MRASQPGGKPALTLASYLCISACLEPQVICPELLTQWQTGLTKHQLPASACQLEIEEQMLLSSDPIIMGALQRIKELKIGLSVGDFGQGHSSLTRLHQLSVNALKIDRTFTQELADDDCAGIVKTIVDLGRSIDIPVIAKGIETPSQLKTLVALGCQFGQGGWLAAPMQAIEIEQMLPV